jgi:hypothetical protein
MNGENVLRGLVLVLFVPAIGAVIAYLVGHPSRAILLNAVVPLLVFIASALVIVTNPPIAITVGGTLYFGIPLGVLLACAVGLRGRRPPPTLFWFTWAINLAIVAFLFYLSFFFTIF